MTKNQKKQKLKHKKEVQKLKNKYIRKTPLSMGVLCKECKYRNICNLKSCDKNIDWCSSGVIDLNIIREYVKHREPKLSFFIA